MSGCLWVIFEWYFEVMHAAVEAGEREKTAVFSASLQRRVQKNRIPPTTSVDTGFNSD